VPVELSTTGEKRSYSALLNSTCKCHATATIKIPRTSKVNRAILHTAAENRLRKICSICKNDVSPFWWPVDTSFDADGRVDVPHVKLYECQKCKWAKAHCNVNR
jgi:hypothetical protein